MAASIVGSAHDLSSDLGTNTEICLPCHAPHNAGATGPLWNHTASAGGYTLYGADSTTFDADDQGITGVSALCMSCHDDTIGVGSVINNKTGDITDTNGTISALFPLNTAADLGLDLSNDHPVSFTYDAALVSADGGAGLNDPVADGIGTLELFGASDNQLECATCHDVHDNALGSFLVLDNANSTLCRTCHTK